VILDPVNDRECLDQLTRFARELAPTTLVRSVAAHLASRDAVIQWLQSLPQTDDDGEEHIRFIQCDVPQRVRLLPDDPNCVERSFGALMLLEALDPKTPRALATVDKPLRHTGLVEQYGGHWHAVDLFPRRNAARNFNWGSFGKDALQGVHSYVGKPILKFYLGDTGGKVADTLGSQEDRWIGRDKKQSEKKDAPPPAGAQRPGAEPKQAQQPAAQGTPPAGRFDFGRLVGAGAKQGQTAPVGAGGHDATNEKAASGARQAAGGHGAADCGCARKQADPGSDRDSYDAIPKSQRFWRAFGR
jgi:hypothetical protein